MKERYYFRWRGRITRDVGTLWIDAYSEAEARRIFDTQNPTRQIVSCMCSVPLPQVKSE